MKKVIIRADDLGYSEGVNYGIAKSVRAGLVNNVGLMTNMPASVHGLELIKGIDLCLGQHTNVCAGNPLTDPKRIPSLTTPEGSFRPSKSYHNAKEDVVFDEAVLEIEAQLEQFIALTGRRPDYLEGHAIFSTNFFKALEAVADKHGLLYCGLSPFSVSAVVGKTMVYLYMDAANPEYNPFSTLKRAVEETHEDAVNMMVCHPGYIDGYLARTSSLTLPRAYEVDMLCDEQTKAYLCEQEVKLLTFREL